MRLTAWFLSSLVPRQKKHPQPGYFRIASAKVRQVFIGALGAYLLRTYEKGTPTSGMP